MSVTAQAVITYSLLVTSLGCMYYYHHFADDKTEAQKGQALCPSVAQEISGTTGKQTEVCADPSSYPLFYPCLISVNPQTILRGRDND